MQHRDPPPTDEHTTVSAAHSRRAWLRAVAASLGAAGLIHVFGAGSCSWTNCDDDDHFDDDDDCYDDDDDDDFGHATTANATPSYRLEQFEVVHADDPRAHPIAHVGNIRGISIGEWSGSGELRPVEFAAFTAKILEYNEDLIGLPASSGRLLFDGVGYGTGGTHVRYVQVAADENGAPRPIPRAGMVFVLDLIGNLVEIDNHTRLW